MINSLKLKRIEIYFHHSNTEIMLEELTVVNAPCLEILNYHGPYKANMHISIISAPKLKVSSLAPLFSMLVRLSFFSVSLLFTIICSFSVKTLIHMIHT